MPTTTLAIIPICAFVAMTMLASQPMMPPMINVMTSPMVSSLGAADRWQTSPRRRTCRHILRRLREHSYPVEI